LLALTFYHYAVLKIDLRKTELLDLKPWPDSIEYFACATEMADHHQFGFRFGGQLYPSRYPVGYPALMVPYLTACRPEKRIRAPFRVNQTVGLLLLLGFAAYYGLHRRPIAGAAAVAVLATFPGFVLLSRSSMSDLSGVALLMAAAAAFSVGVRRAALLPLLLAAAVLGLSTNVRMQYCLLAPLLIAPALVPSWSVSRRILALMWSLVAFVAGAAPMLLINWKIFGSPLRNGYHYWLGRIGDVGFLAFYSPRFLVDQVKYLWAEATLHQSHCNTGNLFGPGVYFTPPHLILILLSVFLVRPTRHRMLIAGVTLFFLGLHLTFRFPDTRLFVPLFLLGFPAVACAVERLAAPTNGGLLWLRLPYGVLFLCAVQGFPSQSGFEFASGRAQIAELLRSDLLGQRSPNYAAVASLRRQIDSDRVLVVSPIPTPYLQALLPRNWSAIPSSGKHEWGLSTLFQFGASEIGAAIQQAVREHRPVVFLAGNAPGGECEPRDIPVPSGYYWQTDQHDPVRGTIAQLVPTTSQLSMRKGPG
jgi:hypothetical protein